MSIYNAGIPTMPMYDVTKRTFGEMMTPEDQIMWIYYHMIQEASVDYVDGENQKQDDEFDAYKAQMLVTLTNLKTDILKEIGPITTYGDLWACQLGHMVNSKQAMRLAHKDTCALLGASVGELGDGMANLMTVEALATSGLNVFGMAAYARTYSHNGTIGAPGAGTASGYPF